MQNSIINIELMIWPLLARCQGYNRMNSSHLDDWGIDFKVVNAMLLVVALNYQTRLVSLYGAIFTKFGLIEPFITNSFLVWW